MGRSSAPERIRDDEFSRQPDGLVIDDARVFNEKLADSEDFYNPARPDEGLGGQSPYERLRQKT